MTKIIATIGPASYNNEVLNFFKNNNVQIIRQNLSHNYVDWHLEVSSKIKDFGFDILLDCPGPKVRLGQVDEIIEVFKGEVIKLEMQKEGVKYPYIDNQGFKMFPNHFPAHKFVKQGDVILNDDGKLEWKVISVNDDIVTCEVIFGGLVKSRKGLNMPLTDLQVEFLTDRDREFLSGLLAKVKPKYVAASFVKTKKDILELKGLIDEILAQNNISDYYPQLCVKLEMGQAVEDQNLEEIINSVDLVMIARGDLALETIPSHIAVPFLQDKIVEFCQRLGKKFIVATQIIESMIDNSVPTRAEVSDLYRAIYINEANFIMCSAETAAGKYPIESIKMMSEMIEYCQENNKNKVREALKSIYQ
jgi:pyruvate kinase